MVIIKTISQAREHIADVRHQGKHIGLVPTMGALHPGHFALIERARRRCEYVVVSIFVNPAQFGPAEDIAKYPRTFDEDCGNCERLGVEMIFAPDNEQMYPTDQLSWVSVERLGDRLCGESRPGHFRGVCTVVAKLFNIIQPDSAYFGQKDAQQLAIIERMVAELNWPIEIHRCPTVREPDGLAISSRNRYLTDGQRREALVLNESLQLAKRLIAGGQRDSQSVIEAIKAVIAGQPSARIDYISIVDKDLLQPLEEIDRPALIAMAVRIGPARLIDNILVDPPAESL